MDSRLLIALGLLLLASPAFAQQQSSPSVNLTTELARIAGNCLNSSEQAARLIQQWDEESDAEQDANE